MSLSAIIGIVSALAALAVPVKAQGAVGTVLSFGLDLTLSQTGFAPFSGAIGTTITTDLSTDAIEQIRSIVSGAVNKYMLDDFKAGADTVFQNSLVYFRNENDYNSTTCGFKAAFDDLHDVEKRLDDADRAGARLNTSSFGPFSAPSYQLMVGLHIALVKEQIAVLRRMPASFQRDEDVKIQQNRLKVDAAQFYETLNTTYLARLADYIVGVHSFDYENKNSGCNLPECCNGNNRHYFLQMRADMKSDGAWTRVSEGLTSCMNCNADPDNCGFDLLRRHIEQRSTRLAEENKLTFFGNDYPKMLAALLGIMNTPAEQLVY